MKQIAIRLDTGPSIGLGHLMRCLSLAEQLQASGQAKVCFICRNKLPQELPYQVQYLKQGAIILEEGYQASDIEDEVHEMRKVLQDQKIDCLIVDHYGAQDEYFEALRDSVPYFVSIDDGLKRQIPVDLIVNGNIYGIHADYGEIPTQLLGGRYTLLRRQFQNLPAKNIRSKLQTLYITSGGADPLGFCHTMLRAVLQYASDCAIHVIAGPDFRKEYIKLLQTYSATVHINANMLECMLDADLFLTSGGSILYELAVTGTPSISYVLAEDQVNAAQEMWNRGCSIRGGWFSEFQAQELAAALEQLRDPKLRQTISSAGRKTVSTAGAEHAADHIMDLLCKKTGGKVDTSQLSLIPAEEGHMDLLFTWANDRETRKYAFQQEPILYSIHKQWMNQKLNSDQTDMFICIHGKESIGQVRVDYFGENGYLDYSMDPAWRSRGFGKQMLVLLEETLLQQKKQPKRLIARVKYENFPSQKVLESLEYKRQELQDFIEYCKELIK